MSTHRRNTSFTNASLHRRASWPASAAGISWGVYREPVRSYSTYGTERKTYRPNLS